MQNEKNRTDESSDSRWKSQSQGNNGSRSSSAAAAVVDEGSKVFESLKDQGTQVADKAKEIATSFKDSAQEYSEMAIDKTSSLIKRYPAQSLLVGFGAGLAIGFLVARR